MLQCLLVRTMFYAKGAEDKMRNTDDFSRLYYQRINSVKKNVTHVQEHGHLLYRAGSYVSSKTNFCALTIHYVDYFTRIVGYFPDFCLLIANSNQFSCFPGVTERDTDDVRSQSHLNSWHCPAFSPRDYQIVWPAVKAALLLPKGKAIIYSQDVV